MNKQMPEQDINKAITAPIHDYLLSIADSLQQVQQQLNHSKVLSEDGQSYTSYHLPKLEFELKMAIELDSVQEDGVQRAVMRAVPVNVTASSKKSQSVIEASTIKGVFVAVPSGLGMPPPIVRTFLRAVKSQEEYEITVILQSAAGGYLNGVEVQFNIDRDSSGKPPATGEPQRAKLLDGTYLRDGIISTDENGRARTHLFIDKNEPDNSPIVVLVDALGKTETIVFEKIKQPA